MAPGSGRGSSGSGVDTEQSFIAAATRLFAERGYKGTSISDLARELQLTTASLYYYVEGKQELLVKVLESGMSDFLLRLQAIADGEEGPREKLARAVENHIDFVVSRRDVVRIFLRQRSELTAESQRHYQELLDRYQRLFTDILVDARPLVAATTDTVLLRQAVLGMINSLVEWYTPQGRLTPEEIKSQLTAAIVEHLLRT